MHRRGETGGDRGKQEGTQKQGHINDMEVVFLTMIIVSKCYNFIVFGLVFNVFESLRHHCSVLTRLIHSYKNYHHWFSGEY